MSTRTRVRQSRSPRPTRATPVFVVALSTTIVVLAVAGWILFRPQPAGQGSTTGGGALPGPLGGSSVSVDVNTLVGKPAPTFTLSDSDGTSYSVTPGQGHPIVLISHMGIT